jgi:hypothetical protein
VSSDEEITGGRIGPYPLPSAFLTHLAIDSITFFQGLEKTCGLRVQPCTGRESLGTNFLVA